MTTLLFSISFTFFLTHSTFGLSREELDEEVLLYGFATDLLSVHLTQTEIAESTLALASVDILSERLERWGVVALQGVISREKSLALADILYVNLTFSIVCFDYQQMIYILAAILHISQLFFHELYFLPFCFFFFFFYFYT